MNRIVFLTNVIPNTEHSTATYCAYLIIEQLLAARYQVSVAVLESSDFPIGNEATRKKWFETVKKLGVEIVVVTKTDLPPAPPPDGFLKRGFRKILMAEVDAHFVGTRFAPWVKSYVEKIKPDGLFIWGEWDTVAAAYQLTTPKFVLVGDPPHLPPHFRSNPPFVHWSVKLSPRWWIHRLLRWGLSRAALRLLQSADAVGATAAHHARWISDNGVPCDYVPNIVPDWGGKNWSERKRGHIRNDGKTRILLMGHITSTVNLDGLYVLAYEIIPELQKSMGDSFEVHICGKGHIPEALKAALTDPQVVFRGFVDDIIVELFSADIFLVPTQIKLGIRVRIPYVWSMGMCVVAHVSNALGLPELKDEENCLLGHNGRELAQKIERLTRDKELQGRLSHNSRASYERYFSFDVTTGKIFDKLRPTLEGKNKR